MIREVDAFKKLAVALGCAKSVEEVKGATTAEVVCFISDNMPKKSKGAKTEN